MEPLVMTNSKDLHPPANQLQNPKIFDEYLPSVYQNTLFLLESDSKLFS